MQKHLSLRKYEQTAFTASMKKEIYKSSTILEIRICWFGSVKC